MDLIIWFIGGSLNTIGLIMIIMNFIRNKPSKIPWIIALTGMTLLFIGLYIHHR